MIQILALWILNIPFVKKEFDRLFADSVRQGSLDAFQKAHADLMETRVDDIEERAEELAQKKLSNLLTVVDESLVVSKNKTGQVYIGGKQAEPGRLANLKAEAEFFEASELYKVMNSTVRELAQGAMFVAGESIEDMKKGRSILYMLDSQKRMIDLFKSFIPK